MGNDPAGERIRLDSRRRFRGEGGGQPTFPLLQTPMDVQRFLVPRESKTEYYTLLAELAIEFPPVDLVTSLLVERLGQQIWSLRRHARSEATYFRTNSPGNRPLGRHDMDGVKFLERIEKNTLRMIKELQRMKKEQATKPLSKEAQVRTSPEILLEKYGQHLGLEKWWRDPEEYFRHQMRYVSPDELEKERVKP
ncbi:MAG: hypothetical protein WBW33_35750 [Bryobacteraceae bacterium]